MNNPNQHGTEDEELKIERIDIADLNKHDLIINPVGYPANVEEFYLAPVECPKGEFNHRILVPAHYHATCLSSQVYPFMGGNKVCLTWGFFLSGYEDLTLRQNIPFYEHFKPTHAYFKQWLLANNGCYPRCATRERMSPKKFVEKSAELLVRFATPLNVDKSKCDALTRYPVVSHIIKIL